MRLTGSTGRKHARNKGQSTVRSHAPSALGLPALGVATTGHISALPTLEGPALRIRDIGGDCSACCWMPSPLVYDLAQDAEFFPENGHQWQAGRQCGAEACDAFLWHRTRTSCAILTTSTSISAPVPMALYRAAARHLNSQVCGSKELRKQLHGIVNRWSGGRSSDKTARNAASTSQGLCGDGGCLTLILTPRAFATGWPPSCGS
jgi:hypothetical protein